LALAFAGVAMAQPTLPIVAIWLAHIGFDRALSYGLKYADAFSHTHLGTIGRGESKGFQLRGRSGFAEYAQRTGALRALGLTSATSANPLRPPR
jgi:hypothetical protein